MKKIIFLLAITAILFSCQEKKQESCCKHEDSVMVDNNHLTLSVLYHQQAAEMKALSFQTFNLAQYRLDAFLETYKGDKPLAIITDIDESVLDNSPFEAKCILDGIDYPEGWDDWCLKAEAVALPGAVKFLTYAKEKGVETFYVTNRKAHLGDATLQNLVNEKFPFADSAHFMPRTDDKSKESRRQKVLEDYEIVMLIGDNLGDFASCFDHCGFDARHASVDSLQAEWGDRFIVLPNTMYGAWLEEIYNCSWDHSREQLDSLRKSALKSF